VVDCMELAKHSFPSANKVLFVKIVDFRPTLPSLPLIAHTYVNPRRIPDILMMESAQNRVNDLVTIRYIEFPLMTTYELEKRGQSSCIDRICSDHTSNWQGCDQLEQRVDVFSLCRHSNSPTTLRSRPHARITYPLPLCNTPYYHPQARAEHP
jgi:hypothetical protein